MAQYIGADGRFYDDQSEFDENGVLRSVVGSPVATAPSAANPAAAQQAEFDRFLEASRQDAANNLEYAKYATVANRANQYSPYGSSIWQRGATDNDPWTQTTTLSPEGQRLFDLDNQLSTKYGETANLGFDKVRGLFENLQLDESKLPQRAINQGQTAQQALLARLEPTLAQEDDALRTRLANQGIGLGSMAYGREMGLQGQKANDLRLQSSMMGINLDNQNRASALDEAYTAQSRPLDLINSLRSGSQVQNPQFNSYAQQATTQGADLMGAANAQYGANLDVANAANARQNQIIGGLFSLGGAALGQK
jgi:hypothetical protein